MAGGAVEDEDTPKQYPSFMKHDAKLIPGFDDGAASLRAKAFLSKFESQDGSVRFDDDGVADLQSHSEDVCRGLEMANQNARDGEIGKILPCHVRNVVSTTLRFCACYSSLAFYRRADRVAIKKTFIAHVKGR